MAGKESEFVALVQQASASQANTSGKNKFCRKYGLSGGQLSSNSALSSSLVANLASASQKPVHEILPNFEASAGGYFRQAWE